MWCIAVASAPVAMNLLYNVAFTGDLVRLRSSQRCQLAYPMYC